jgi:hypothetical protein
LLEERFPSTWHDMPRSTRRLSWRGVFRRPPAPSNVWARQIFFPFVTYSLINAAVICQQIALICLILQVSWQIFSGPGIHSTLSAISGGAVDVRLGAAAASLSVVLITWYAALVWVLKCIHRAVRIYVDTSRRRDDSYEMRGSYPTGGRRFIDSSARLLL